jgi:hypothetical protein
LYLVDTGIKNPFLITLRFAARKPAAQGKGFSFLYPAFTSQRVRKTAPTLIRPIRSAQGKLCWAIFGPPLRGWLLAAWTIDSHF